MAVLSFPQNFIDLGNYDGWNDKREWQFVHFDIFGIVTKNPIWYLFMLN